MSNLATVEKERNRAGVGRGTRGGRAFLSRSALCRAAAVDTRSRYGSAASLVGTATSRSVELSASPFLCAKSRASGASERRCRMK